MIRFLQFVIRFLELWRGGLGVCLFGMLWLIGLLILLHVAGSPFLSIIESVMKPLDGITLALLCVYSSGFVAFVLAWFEPGH